MGELLASRRRSKYPPVKKDELSAQNSPRDSEVIRISWLNTSDAEKACVATIRVPRASLSGYWLRPGSVFEQSKRKSPFSRKAAAVHTGPLQPR